MAAIQPPTTPGSSTHMHSTYYQEPHFTGQETQYFPGTYPELPTFYQYLHDSTYQDAVLDLRVAPHAQSLTPLSISEDGCSYVITSPLGTPTVRHQVSPSAAYKVGGPSLTHSSQLVCYPRAISRRPLAMIMRAIIVAGRVLKFTIARPRPD